jgi:hypothetical protein
MLHDAMRADVMQSSSPNARHQPGELNLSELMRREQGDSGIHHIVILKLQEHCQPAEAASRSADYET